jgi:hypothetical protein
MPRHAGGPTVFVMEQVGAASEAVERLRRRDEDSWRADNETMAAADCFVI